jgi:hypothetical protein
MKARKDFRKKEEANKKVWKGKKKGRVKVGTRAGMYSSLSACSTGRNYPHH